jgi:hypothetical protein
MTFRDGVSNDVWLKNQNDLHLIFPASSNSEENLTFCFYDVQKNAWKGTTSFGSRALYVELATKPPRPLVA